VSYDPDGTIVSYYWDFGDGNTGTEDIVNHSYLKSGIYSVILKVIDDEGLMGSSVVAVMVRNRAPIAAITEMTSIINENEEVAFDASSSNDVDGTIVSYIWSFGDETAASGITVVHTYANSGLFNVTLTVIDDEGASGSVVQSIQVKNVDNILPEASISLNVETADINEAVSFDGSRSFDSDGNIVSYSWDFGDGKSATGAQVDHKYDRSGVFTVKLTISDNDGAIVEKTSVITITNDVVNSPPVASFTKNSATVMQGESIYIDASESHDPDGTIVSYTWDFGDEKTATGVTTEHAYYESGIYTITLTVTDNDGVSSSMGAEITVEAESNVSMAVLSGIGIGIAALVAALLYVIFKRRKPKE
jgi:PKD repeat protein